MGAVSVGLVFLFIAQNSRSIHLPVLWHSGRDLCSQGRAVCEFHFSPSEWFYCFPGSHSRSPGEDDVNGAVPDTQEAFNGPIKQLEDSSSCGLKAFPEDFLLLCEFVLGSKGWST